MEMDVENRQVWLVDTSLRETLDEWAADRPLLVRVVKVMVLHSAILMVSVILETNAMIVRLLSVLRV